MDNKTVPVWDIAVRVFHWSLVAFFALSYLTGEEEITLHIYAGYAVLGLIVFRVLWGFIGSRYARFSDFVRSRAVVVAYLKAMLAGSPKRYLGHTPPGGWMILALLASLLLTSLSGLQVYGLEGYGPLAGASFSAELVTPAHADDDDDEHERRHGSAYAGHESEDEAGEEMWEEVHEFFANLTVLLVFVHSAAVVVTGRLHRENLVKAMLTGKKSADTGH
jgi:cytochrome b